MPDCDNWTAAMVLKWVLTRDQAAILAMVATYGAVGVFEDHTVSRLAPEDIEAVMIAYCIDPTLPPGEEKDATAVVRSQRVIAAKDEIYQALRRGELEARARRNGAGDVETIAPNQWLSLKFQSWDGHDLAVPINVEKDILNLPRAFEDYVGGRVAADVLPAVWPDPHFIAKQVLQIWPCLELTQMGGSAAAPTRNADEAALGEPPERPDGVSERDWQTYVSALEKGFDLGIRGNITKAARSIASDRGHGGDYESERRALHRVRAKLSEQWIN
jgi:hypothetical protein